METTFAIQIPEGREAVEVRPAGKDDFWMSAASTGESLVYRCPLGSKGIPVVIVSKVLWYPKTGDTVYVISDQMAGWVVREILFDSSKTIMLSRLAQGLIYRTSDAANEALTKLRNALSVVQKCMGYQTYEYRDEPYSADGNRTDAKTSK